MDGLRREGSAIGQLGSSLQQLAEPSGCFVWHEGRQQRRGPVLVVDRSQLVETHVTRVSWGIQDMHPEFLMSCSSHFPWVIMGLSIAFGLGNKKTRCGPIPRRCECGKTKWNWTEIRGQNRRPTEAWSARPVLVRASRCRCGEARTWPAVRTQSEPRGEVGPTTASAGWRSRPCPGWLDWLAGCCCWAVGLPAGSGWRAGAGWLFLCAACLHARMPSRAQPVASPQFNPKNEPHFFIASHRILDNTSPPRAFSRPEVAAPAPLDDSPFLFFGSSGSAL